MNVEMGEGEGNNKRSESHVRMKPSTLNRSQSNAYVTGVSDGYGRVTAREIKAIDIKQHVHDLYGPDIPLGCNAGMEVVK